MQMKIFVLLIVALGMAGCREPRPVHECRVMFLEMCEHLDKCQIVSYPECTITSAVEIDCSTASVEDIPNIRQCASSFQTMTCDDKLSEVCYSLR